MTTLDERLWKTEQEFMTLCGRLFALEAFQRELDRVTHGKEFSVANDIMWTTLFDTRDAFVIHFASWGKAQYEPGGLCGQLRAHHRTELPSKRLSTLTRTEDPQLEGSLDQRHAAAFDSLFSCHCGTYPTDAGFTTLTERFAELMKPVIDDRSVNRAHPYENVKRRGSVKMLNFEEQRKVVTAAQSFLNSIRAVAGLPKMTHVEANEADAKLVAEEWVDSVLLGTRQRQAQIRGNQNREEFYELMHTNQATMGGLFNDCWE